MVSQQDVSSMLEKLDMGDLRKPHAPLGGWMLPWINPPDSSLIVVEQTAAQRLDEEQPVHGIGGSETYRVPTEPAKRGADMEAPQAGPQAQAHNSYSSLRLVFDCTAQPRPFPSRCPRTPARLPSSSTSKFDPHATSDAGDDRERGAGHAGNPAYGIIGVGLDISYMEEF